VSDVLEAMAAAAFEALETTTEHQVIGTVKVSTFNEGEIVAAALKAARDAGFILAPMNADTFMVEAYRDHESNPARSVQSTWRRMIEASPYGDGYGSTKAPSDG